MSFFPNVSAAKPFSMFFYSYILWKHKTQTQVPKRNSPVNHNQMLITIGTYLRLIPLLKCSNSNVIFEYILGSYRYRCVRYRYRIKACTISYKLNLNFFKLALKNKKKPVYFFIF